MRLLNLANCMLQLLKISRNKFLCSLFLLFIFCTVAQDSDSLQIKLFNASDLQQDSIVVKSTIIKGSLLNETVDETSSQIIIVEGSEIRKLGYTTLVDVLKNVPGFRTSQPGNSYEGETFLMRGLVGNEYVKFMINGVSIKPEAVNGMPIASQLPIRHAERIEIIFGANSATFGTDCMGGIINIVMPEVDHPVYAWSDISLISPSSSDFNLTLGGKAGQGANIFRYQFFASSYLSNKINLLTTTDIFSLDTSSASLSPIQKELYIHQNYSYDETELKRLRMSRESRVLGAHFNYKRMEFSMMQFYRKEHSGIGMNPLEQSSNDPESFFGEKIISSVFRFNIKNTAKVESLFRASFLYYTILPESSYTSITNQLAIGKNYINSTSNTSNLEYQNLLKISENFKINYGASFSVDFSSPFMNHIQRSIDGSSYQDKVSPEILNYNKIDSLSNEIVYRKFSKTNLAYFTQLKYSTKSKKIQTFAGIRFDKTSIYAPYYDNFIDNDSLTFSNVVFLNFKNFIPSPKVGILLKPLKRITVKLNWGTAFRTPNSYNISNNYTSTLTNYNLGNKLSRISVELKPERMQSIDASVQYSNNISWTIVAGYYFHQIKDKIFNQMYVPDATSSPNSNSFDLLRYGYANSDGTSNLHTLSVVNTNYIIFNDVKIDIIVAYEYSKGNEKIYSNVNKSVVPSFSNAYRYVPTHTLKLNFVFNLKDLKVSICNNIYGNSITGVSTINEVNYVSSSTLKNRNVDVLIYKQLFRQLNGFLGVTNVFKSTQVGISAPQLTDTWTLCPQYGRIYKFGLTFKLN